MREIKKVAVVGGGTAGWLAAASLAAAFMPDLEVVLIEPERPNKIGVGESTLPTILGTLKRIDCLDHDFLRRVDATFKQGIRFEDWANIGHHFYHPYDYTSAPKYHRLASFLQADEGGDFARTVTHQTAALDQNLSPFRATNEGLAPHYRYSLHVDAEKLADTVKARQLKSGRVTLVTGEVAECAFSGDTLQSVILKDGQAVAADLFIDCTGQRRLLSKPGACLKTYDHLPVDRAIASRPHHAGAAIPSHTLAKAWASGWIWDIPLARRRGVGVVYSSQHASEDDARAALTNHIGADPGDTKVIKFLSGVLERPWDGNVVSIGLSAGFIEPLESTGIYFIEEAINLLIAFFPLGGSRHSRRQFNAALIERYDECADFVFLHYFLSQRRDSAFWRDVTSASKAPRHVLEQLEFWAEMPPCPEQFLRVRQLFADVAYEYVLYGMGWHPSQDLVHAIKAMELPQSKAPKSYPRLLSNVEVLKMLIGGAQDFTNNA
jgi:tryptophan halogenase